MTRVHKLREMSNGLSSFRVSLCDDKSFRRLLHVSWSEVTCPKCLAMKPPDPCPNCGRTHAQNSYGCVDAP